MNRKILIALIIGVVALTGGITAFLLSNQQANLNGQADSQTDNETVEMVAVKACDLLTLDEAKRLLGNNTTESGNVSAVANSDMNVDTCSYTNNGLTADTIRIVTVMARSALTDIGLDSNTGAFESGGTANPKGAITVSEFGDKAFWDPTTFQLSILDGNTWISIVYGGTNPLKNTLDDAKKVARLVVE